MVNQEYYLNDLEIETDNTTMANIIFVGYYTIETKVFRILFAANETHVVLYFNVTFNIKHAVFYRKIDPNKIDTVLKVHFDVAKINEVHVP